MRSCSQTLAWLTAVFFVIAAVAALFLFNLAQVATDRDAVRAAFGDEARLRASLVAFLAAGLQQTAADQGLPVEAGDTAAFTAAVEQLLPPGWMAQQADAAVDATYDALEADGAVWPELTVDLSPLLPQLRGEPGRRAAAALLANLPPCPPDAPFVIDPATGQITLDRCLPAFVSADEAAVLLHGAVITQLDANPALLGANFRYTLPLIPQDDPDAWQNWLRLRRLFQLTRRWAWLLWLPALGGFLLATLLAVRSLPGLGRWWGGMLAAAGGLTLFLSLLPPLFGLLNTSPGERATAAFSRLLGVAVANLGRLWLADVRWGALILLVAGLLFLTASLIRPDNN